MPASSTAQNASQKAIERFAAMMIERMEAIKDSPWEKGWLPAPGTTVGLPQNITGRNYSGGNSFFLQLLSSGEGYKSPVFLTFKQANNLGAHVLKGEAAFPVVYWDMIIKDAQGNKVPKENLATMSAEEKMELNAVPFIKVFPVYNIDQTNLAEVKPDKYDAIISRLKAPQLRDASGMFADGSLDSMVAQQAWVCPIYADKPSNNAYYSPGDDFIRLPQKEQFNKGGTTEEIYRGGMEFYATMLHEMTHSTMTPERLKRDGGRFGDPKYAKEELVAEMTAALIGNSLGFDMRITGNSAKYLDGWIGVLKKEPKFILSLMSDVNKASEMILDAYDRQRIANGIEPVLTKNNPNLNASDLEAPFRNASVIKTRDGSYAVRANVDGNDLGSKPIDKESAKLFFKLTDQREKDIFLSETVAKLFSAEIDNVRNITKTRTQKV